MAEHRHKRETNARRKPRAALVAGPIALLATASAVTLGVSPATPVPRHLLAQPERRRHHAAARAPAGVALAVATHGEGRPAKIDAAREGGDRHGASAAPTPSCGRRPSSTSGPTRPRLPSRSASRGRQAGAGHRSQGRRPGRDRRRRQVALGDRGLPLRGEAARRRRRPVDGAVPRPRRRERPDRATRSTSTAPCATPSRRSRRTAAGTGTASTSSGRALDIMTSDVGLGTAIAEFLRAHAAELNLYDVLWRQRIWTPVRAARAGGRCRRAARPPPTTTTTCTCRPTEAARSADEVRRRGHVSYAESAETDRRSGAGEDGLRRLRASRNPRWTDPQAPRAKRGGRDGDHLNRPASAPSEARRARR